MIFLPRLFPKMNKIEFIAMTLLVFLLSSPGVYGAEGKKVGGSIPPREKKSPASVRAATESSGTPPGWSLGLAYTGGLIRYRPRARWGVEGRWLVDSSDSIHATALGARIYRFFAAGRVDYYAGVEGDGLTARSRPDDLSFRGWSAGAFLGVERRLTRRLSVGMDGGIYDIDLKAASIGAAGNGVDFVLNTALIYRFS